MSPSSRRLRGAAPRPQDREQATEEQPTQATLSRCTKRQRGNPQAHYTSKESRHLCSALPPPQKADEAVAPSSVKQAGSKIALSSFSTFYDTVLIHPPVHVDGAGPWRRTPDHPANHVPPFSLLRSLVHSRVPVSFSLCAVSPTGVPYLVMIPLFNRDLPEPPRRKGGTQAVRPHGRIVKKTRAALCEGNQTDRIHGSESQRECKSEVGAILFRGGSGVAAESGEHGREREPPIAGGA